MKTNFDWQTEESGKLEKVDLADHVPPSRRKLGCLTLTLVFSAVAISALAWLLNQRQSETVANISEDVLLAFHLQQQAADNNDQELFSEMLSADDPAWKHKQEQLLAVSLFNDRGGIGLFGDAGSRAYRALDLSPDLQKAELSYMQAYTAGAGAPDSSDIELLHTLVFRLEDGRWQNAPSDLSFWGPWKEVAGELIVVTTPERDAELAQQLVGKIDTRLKRVCADVNEENDFGFAYCEGNVPWRIKLSTDIETLLIFAEVPAVQASEFDYELPAPSIIGVPQNETDYETYFNIYAHALMQKMEAALLTTAPFPDQTVYALCFDHPQSGRHLYRYNWRLRSWQPILQAQSFHHLSTLPDDSAIMLAGESTLTVMEAARETDSAGHAAVWQGSLPSLDSKSPLGWIATADAPYYLLQEAGSAGMLPDYGSLDLRDCDASGCSIITLPGFPVASTSSDASLYLIGSQIVVRSGMDDSLKPVGTGFSPFWVDGDSFGFVRFEGDIDTGISTQVVLGSPENNDLRELFDSYDLSRAAAILWGTVLYVNEVIPNPADPGMLLVSTTGIRDYAGHYFIFSTELSDSLNQQGRLDLKLELSRSGTQGGVPGLLSPTGPPSFLVSANGRWLAMTELNGQDSETWTVLVHDLQTGTTTEVSDNVPAMPGNFPQLDWSGDGQWLLVADRNNLQLIAPGYGHQELIAHDFDACSQVVWAD